MEPEVTFSITEGGIPVIIESIPGCESVGVMVAVSTGSRDESKNNYGISHLLEHVIFRNTKNRTSLQMANEIEGAGGELNAFTGREVTAYYGITIAETKEVVKDLISEIVTCPDFNEKDLELEKKIVLQELSMIKNDPGTYIHDLFTKFLWRGHELQNDEGGDEKIVKSLTVDDLMKYYDERYGSPNMSAFLAGSVNPSAALLWAQEKLDVTGGKKPIVRTPPKTPVAGYLFEENKSPHCEIAMGFPTYGGNDPKGVELMIVSAALGMGTSSRLFQTVRETNALVYSIYTSIDHHSDCSSMEVHMSATQENAAKAIRMTAEVMSGFKKEGIGEEELERTKRLVKGQIVRYMESTERRLYKMSDQYVLAGEYHPMSYRLEKISNITKESVDEVIDEVIRSDRLNTVVLGGSNRALRKFDYTSLDI